MYLKNFKLQSFSLQSKTTQETRPYMTMYIYKSIESTLVLFRWWTLIVS